MPRERKRIPLKRKNRSQKAAEPAVELPTGEIKISIVFEAKEDKVLHTVTVDAEQSLADIDQQFRESGSAPSNLFHYLCRSHGVHQEWWDIFKAKYFYPQIILRGGTIHMPTITVTSVDGSASAAATDEVKVEHNPYLKKAATTAEKEQQRMEKKQQEDMWEFKPAGITSGFEVKTFVAPMPAFVPVQKPVQPQKKTVEEAATMVRGDPSVQLAQRAISIFGALD